MELSIFWTDFAKNELRQIFDYHKDKAGSTIAKKLVNGIYKTTLLLIEKPEIGQEEELLAGRPQGFRYLGYPEKPSVQVDNIGAFSL